MKINCPGCGLLFSLRRGFPLHCQYSAGCIQAFLIAGGAKSFIAFSSTNDSPSTVNEMQSRPEVGHLPDSEASFPMDEVEEYENEILSEEESENDD